MGKSKKLAAGNLLAGFLAVAVLLCWTATWVVLRPYATATDRRITLVLVDNAIANQDKLLGPLLSSPSIRIEKFSADDRSLSALGAIAAKYHDVASIHILSHGRKGVLQLSNQNLDANSLDAARPAFDKLAQALNPDGEVFLYGCEIGAGESGKALVDNLAKIIGHRVAASTNETGAAKLGGDWVLERQSAPMQMAALDLSQWNDVLAQNNTGAWTTGTNTGSNSITVGSNTVTATVTMGSFSTGTTSATISQQTFNTIPVFTPAIQGTPSLGVTYTWDTAPEGSNILASDDGGTEVMTIDFSAPVKDPILHIDRIGGQSNGEQNGLTMTLQTGGVTLTRLSGTSHFVVAGNSITNSEIGQPTGGSYTAESSTDPTNGTASGSVQLNGTFTSVSFLLAPGTNALEGTGADAIEVGLTYDPLPDAVADALSGYVNTTLSANLFADNGSGADSDFNGDSLTITKINGAAFTVGTPIALSNGSLTVTNAGTGAVSFAPTANFTGVQTFDYTIADANGGTSTATVTMTFLRTTVTLTNTSLGGVGGFTFTGGNGWSSQTITTVTSGVGVSGTAQTLTAPSTSTTITESVPAGYTVTAISCSGLGSGTATPNLGAGSVVLNAAATAAGNSVACSFTNTKTPTAKFQVTTVGNLGGPFVFSAPSNLASAPGNISTIAVNSPAPSSPTAINISAIGSQVQLTETPASGYTLTGVSCTDANSAITGNSGSFGTLAGNVLTIPSGKVVASADFTCVLTNTKTPTFKLQVSTAGGFGGAFAFAQTNLASAPSNITTTAANTPTPISPTAINISTSGTAITVTGTPPSGFDLNAVSCTDANSAITNNIGSFGSFASNVLTVAAGNVVAGADITCVLSSNKLATLTLTMKSNGGVTGFTFTGTNGWSSQTITTVTPGSGVAGATQTLTAASTATTITQAIPSSYSFSSVTCSGMGAGTVTPTLATGAMLFDAAATAPGNAIACTVIDDKTATFKLQVTTTGGFGGAFSFAQTNLASAPSDITTVAAGTATPASPVAINVSTIGSAVTVTGTPPAGFDLNAVACTDANSGATGNTGIFGSLASNVLTVASANVKPGAAFTCVLSSNKLPTLTLTMKSNGGVTGFTFTGTNGWSSQTITTVTPGSGVAGATQALAAASTPTTITQAIPSSYSFASVTCTGLGSGSVTPTLGTGAMLFDAVATVAGAAIACTVTDNKAATFKLQKFTLGGFAGPFNFAQTNLASAPTSITTSAEATATPTSPTGVDIVTVGTAVTVTETPPAGYAITAINCTDANGAITGNTGSFGSFSGAVLTLASGNIVAGADITCVTTSTRPRIKLQKTTVGGAGGPFTFTTTNLATTPGAITTVSASTPTPASPAANNVTIVGADVTITEPTKVGFVISAASCTDDNAAITGNSGSLGTLSGTTLTLPAAFVKPGADFTCVFSNTNAVPSLVVVKSASSSGPLDYGQTVTYTYRVTNAGNVPMTNVNVVDSHNGSGTFTGPDNETLTTDVAPATDSSDGTPNDGKWDTLAPGDTVTFTASYVVTQYDVDYLH